MSERGDERIIVTGGTGFVGTHLVEYLLAAGYQHVHVTSYSADVGYLSGVLPAEHIHQLDLTNAAATESLFAALAPTQVYHLAAIAAVSDSFTQAERVLVNNTQVQLNVLNAVLRQAPSARVLAVSSAEVYGKVEADQVPITETQPLRPINPYAVSKATQDLLAQSYWLSHKLSIVRARPFNHIGERQVADFVVPSFAKQITAVERGEQSSLQVGNLEAVRDFLDVKDVVAAYELLLRVGVPGEVYNIASGKGHTVQAVLDMLLSHAAVSVPVMQDPGRMRPSDTPITIGDASKIGALGWKPRYTLSDTLSRILTYWRTTT